MFLRAFKCSWVYRIYYVLLIWFNQFKTEKIGLSNASLYKYSQQCKHLNKIISFIDKQIFRLYLIPSNTWKKSINLTNRQLIVKNELVFNCSLFPQCTLKKLQYFVISLLFHSRYTNILTLYGNCIHFRKKNV